MLQFQRGNYISSRQFCCFWDDVEYKVMFQWLGCIMKKFASCSRSTRIQFSRYCYSTGPSTSKRSYYEILGVKNNATQSEIRDAFVRLSKKYHPDVNKDDKNAHHQFVEINEAYTVLSKNDSRRDYDSQLRQGWTSDAQMPPYNDPNRELYRRYYDQLYREQERQRQRQRTPPPRGFSKFDGPYEDPFRDFWREFDRPFEQQQQGSRRTKLDEQANKAFYLFIMAVVSLTIIVHFLQYTMIRQKPHPYEYGDIDRDLDQWRNVSSMDRPEEKQPDWERSSSKERGSRIVEA